MYGNDGTIASSVPCGQPPANNVSSNSTANCRLPFNYLLAATIRLRMSRTCEAIDHASIAGYGPVRQSTLPPRIPHRVAANREPPPRRHNGLTIPGLADSGDCSCALDCLFPACALPLPPAAVRRKAPILLPTKRLNQRAFQRRNSSMRYMRSIGRRHWSVTRCAPPSSAMRATTIACPRSEEHTSELQSLMRNSYAVFCL